MEEDGSITERKIKMKENKSISCKGDIIVIAVATIIILILVQFMRTPWAAEDYNIFLVLMTAFCIRSIINTKIYNKSFYRHRNKN